MSTIARISNRHGRDVGRPIRSESGPARARSTGLTPRPASQLVQAHPSTAPASAVKAGEVRPTTTPEALLGPEARMTAATRLSAYLPTSLPALSQSPPVILPPGP